MHFSYLPKIVLMTKSSLRGFHNFWDDFEPDHLKNYETLSNLYFHFYVSLIILLFCFVLFQVFIEFKISEKVYTGPPTSTGNILDCKNINLHKTWLELWLGPHLISYSWLRLSLLSTVRKQLKKKKRESNAI